MSGGNFKLPGKTVIPEVVAFVFAVVWAVSLLTLLYYASDTVIMLRADLKQRADNPVKMCQISEVTK